MISYNKFYYFEGYYHDGNEFKIMLLNVNKF